MSTSPHFASTSSQIEPIEPPAGLASSGGQGPAVYWLTSSPPAHLLDSLKEVASGGAPMSPEIARRVVEMFHDLRHPASADYRLTQQESTLLRLLVDGRHRKTAAKAMGISVNTVSFHLKNIYAKLQVHSKTEAVAKALRERLL